MIHNKIYSILIKFKKFFSEAVSLNDVQVRKIIEKLLDRLVEDALEGITVDNLTTHHASEF